MILDKYGRRLAAAWPDFLLAWYCLGSARLVLAGEPADTYVVALVILESISLSTIWLILHGSPRRWQSIIGAARSVLTAVLLYFSLIAGAMALLALLFIDPPLFVLLAIAVCRRFLWLWSWRVKAEIDREVLVEYGRHLSRVHLLAAVLAVGVGLMLRQFFNFDIDTAALDEGFWLAGMAAYFAALGIYVLAGKQPELGSSENSLASPLAFAGIESPPLAMLAQTLTQNWLNYLPGAAILWVFMRFSERLLSMDVLLLFSPVLIMLGALPLLAAVASTLGVQQANLPAFAWRRRHACGYTMLLMWFVSLVVLFIAVPVVASLLDLELSNGLGSIPLFQSGMGVVVIAIGFLALRLWPAIVLPFLLPEQLLEGTSLNLLRWAWTMTDGLDGFFRGAAMPILLLPPILWLMQLPADWALAGEALVYLVLAPALGLLMLERTLVMSCARLELPLLVTNAESADLVGLEEVDRD